MFSKKANVEQLLRIYETARTTSAGREAP
jgi:hypothetical protein